MAEPDVIRVVLVDDHRHVHQAVATVISTAADVALVGQAGNGEEALLLCEQLKPDVVLMDVIMPGMDGVAATKAIFQRFPQIKVLVLSSFQDDESVHAMLRGGAAGYVLKSALLSDLLNTIRAVQQGMQVFSPEITELLLNPSAESAAAESAADYGLTPREVEVLALMVAGLNNKEIAAKLTVSGSTVKFHLAHIVEKLSVETRSEAIAVAAKQRLV